MKLTLLVIALKIVELAALVFISGLLPVWIGRFLHKQFAKMGNYYSRDLSSWELGALAMCAIAACSIVLWVVLPANIAWAKRILGI